MKSAATASYTSGGSENFEKGAEDNLSAASSFIANAHNEIYAFYTEKNRFLRKKYEPIGGGAAAPTVPLPRIRH